MFRRGLRAKLLNVDIRKKPQPEIAFNMVNMVNSRQRKRRVRMNEMSMEREPRYLKVRLRVAYVGVHASEEGPYSLEKFSTYRHRFGRHSS